MSPKSQKSLGGPPLPLKFIFDEKTCLAVEKTVKTVVNTVTQNETNEPFLGSISKKKNSKFFSSKKTKQLFLMRLPFSDAGADEKCFLCGLRLTFLSCFII
jgi:hypothetical protein